LLMNSANPSKINILDIHAVNAKVFTKLFK